MSTNAMALTVAVKTMSKLISVTYTLKLGEFAQLMIISLFIALLRFSKIIVSQSLYMFT